jgi:nicotinate phosphoribosyltransferase
VDFNNDCVTDSCRTAEALFHEYRKCLEAGNVEEAQRYVLFGVRLDTASALIDRSLQPSDNVADHGVTPQLVHNVRAALNKSYEDWRMPPEWSDRAAAYCKKIRISVTGGFTPSKIRAFEDEQVPVDVYGVGSYLFSNAAEAGTNNDYTADVVRVKVSDKWVDLAKTGRQRLENPDLKPVDLSQL